MMAAGAFGRVKTVRTVDLDKRHSTAVVGTDVEGLESSFGGRLPKAPVGGASHGGPSADDDARRDVPRARILGSVTGIG